MPENSKSKPLDFLFHAQGGWLTLRPLKGPYIHVGSDLMLNTMKDYLLAIQVTLGLPCQFCPGSCLIAPLETKGARNNFTCPRYGA